MAFTIDNDGLGRPNQAQFGKRRTDVFAREYNAVVLRGVSTAMQNHCFNDVFQTH